MLPDHRTDRRDTADARMVRVPEAGHSSNLEQPVVVDDAHGELFADVY